MNTAETERVERETGRVEAFSDGVFAIAMTLLVLDLKLPHVDNSHNLFAALLSQWPTFIAFLNSFVTVLIIWMNHHNLFSQYIVKTNNVFMLMNGLLLLTVTVIPFPTSLVAEYYGTPNAIAAAALYSGTFLLMAIAFNMIWYYASNSHRLLKKTVTREQIESIKRQYYLGPSAYSVAFVLSFINVPASLIIIVALMIFYGVTASMSRG
ncbi:MAG TPA: TMEM175 family protein [Bacteroidota bacterium]|nr:TMEM175 family protein [Bacteroidota bacterium]